MRYSLTPLKNKTCITYSNKLPNILAFSSRFRRLSSCVGKKSYFIITPSTVFTLPTLIANLHARPSLTYWGHLPKMPNGKEVYTYVYFKGTYRYCNTLLHNFIPPLWTTSVVECFSLYLLTNQIYFNVLSMNHELSIGDCCLSLLFV